MYWLFLCLALFSCTKKEKLTHIRGVAMTIPYHIQIGESLHKKKQRKVLKVIEKTFNRIDETLNHWNPHSELAVLNRLPANSSKEVSAEFCTMLTLSKRYHALSNGLFDPSCGEAIEKWKRALIEESFPQDCESSSGLHTLTIEDNICTKKKKLALDFDGIAKGYTVDLLVENLEKLGISSLYVNWGGEIRTLGRHPTNRAWQIKLPHSDTVLPLENQAVATSGNTLQYGYIDTLPYSHYIDPSSQRALPAHAPLVVTVIAPTCAQADALATIALLLQNKTKIKEFFNDLHGITYYIDANETE